MNGEVGGGGRCAKRAPNASPFLLSAPLRPISRSRAEGLPGEDVLGDDHALDLAGAFADFAELRVAEVSLDVELADVAVAAVHLDGHVARARRGLAREELGHGGGLRVRLAGIGAARGPVEPRGRTGGRGVRAG